MQITVLSFSRSPKPFVVATARIELTVEGEPIIIDDARVLRNKQGQLWLAMPSYSVPSGNGRSYDYLPALVLSTKLKREVEDAVLSALEEWEREKSAGVRP